MENIDQIIAELGANYQNDKEVLKGILEEINSVAYDISKNKNQAKLFPYIKKAVKAIYLCRGTEGLQSRSEGSITSSYEDVIEKLRNDIIKNGLRRIQ